MASRKREAALSRLVSAGLGKTSPLPALHEWNFDAAPFFLEYAWGGRDLLAWANGGFSRDAGWASHPPPPAYVFDQQVQVRAHSRALTQVFGRPLRDPRTVQVRAHSMHMRFPARAPFRTSAEERQQNYGQAISAAILTAWKTDPSK